MDECQSCDNEAEELHKCPFNEEIGDGKRICNCCADCQHQCAMDI